MATFCKLDFNQWIRDGSVTKQDSFQVAWCNSAHWPPEERVLTRWAAGVDNKGYCFVRIVSKIIQLHLDQIPLYIGTGRASENNMQ